LYKYYLLSDSWKTFYPHNLFTATDWP